MNEETSEKEKRKYQSCTSLVKFLRLTWGHISNHIEPLYRSQCLQIPSPARLTFEVICY